ncbi:MAG TPA: transglycosylase domain-containing protein, partial [Bacteroidia bacterium]|nr:transglycosylase domain-containing protein [Bacteroidia bacterium]
MAAAEKRDSFRKYILLFWAIIIAPILFLAILITAVSLGWMGKLPTFEQLENPKNNLATEVYSSDMQVLGKYYVENRSDVKFKQLSPNLVHALVATEDARFYEHSGVDIRGLFRVMFKTILGGKESSGGGSTLTQQLAKMLFPREDHSSKIHLVIRKIKEWVIATRLERQYTKDEILSMYLNKFDFMNNAVGIKSAANIYFDTSPDKLSLGEAAMLVGMEKNPSLFNPIRRPKATKERRDVVLSQMFKYKYISKLQMDSTATTALELKFHPENHNEGLATYFREYLRDNFLRKWCDEHRKTDGTKYDIYKDGLKIYTTIDSRMQRYAEEAVEKNCKDLQAKFFEECKHKRNSPFDYRVSKEQIKNIMTDAMRRSDRYRSLKEAGMPQDSIILIFNTPIPMTVFSWHGDIDTTLSPMDSIRYSKCFQQAGFMSMDPQTGYIKAWVGGINHKYFKYDHVKEGKRQVGSTFKSFVYALAIQEGYSPCYEVPNVPVTVHYDGKDWSPINADNDDDGKMMTLKEALAKSVNRIAAFLIKQFG